MVTYFSTRSGGSEAYRTHVPFRMKDVQNFLVGAQGRFKDLPHAFSLTYFYQNNHKRVECQRFNQG